MCMVLGVCGCMVPKGQLNTCQTQNRALTEKNAALQSEVENLRAHRDQLVRKLQQVEEEAALVRQENELIRRRLELKEQASARSDSAYGASQTGVSAESRLRLEQLSKRFPSLGLNPVSSQCLLLSERIFQPGQSQLKPEAESTLANLIQLLQSTEGKDLRVWIVVESAEQRTEQSGRAGVNSLGPLASQQALALKEKLCQMGLPTDRIGLAAVPRSNLPENASTQPPTGSSQLKVFLLPPEIPIIGWLGQQIQRL
ncbi:MAG: hypothetical protein NZ602_06360 [Thermoguttaceae bacterium]|nr:hypothetical protein [Thermoguttaceae bacterium]MDW8037965.1 hypothetical protein [Thermoguttaceae bacterium]